MAITSSTYGPFGYHLVKGDIDLDTAVMKISLHTSGYTPSTDHEFFSNVNSEITGTGYTAGGAPISTLTTAYDSTNKWAKVDGNDVTWTGLNATYRYAVARIDTGTAATSPLVFWIDFGANQTAGGTDVSLQWDATGFLHLSAV